MKIKNLLEKKYTWIIIIISIITIVLLTIYAFSNRNQSTTKQKYLEYNFITNELPVIDTGHYALWGIDNEGKSKLLKRFNYNGSKLISLNLTELKSINLNTDLLFDKYEITVEKLGDLDEEKSQCLLLKGVREENKVEFKLTALDQEKIAGSFILATHTDQTTTTNETSGIWFTDNIDGLNTKPSLILENLPDCWKYAAYIKYRDVYLKIGEFKTNNQADEFSDYSYAQLEPLKIPGEDFLRNLPHNILAPINIAAQNNTLILAIEPDTKIMNPKLQSSPFWEISYYNFNGKEKVRTAIPIEKTSKYLLALSINQVEF